MTSPFVDAMMTQFGSRQTKQYGENGAVEFSTHGVKGDGSRDVEGYLSVAFADILRGTTPANIHSYTDNVFRSKDVTNKDIEDFFALIFHTRECRGDGKGERTAMYHLLFATAHHRPKVIIDLLEHIPEYGYWKDFQNIIELIKTTYSSHPEAENMINKIYNIWVDQLHEDIKSVRSDEEWDHVSQDCYDDTESVKINISLAAKYFPKEGKSLDKKYKVSLSMAKLYFDKYGSWHKMPQTTLKETTHKTFRKEVISPLTQEINLTERFMCAKEFSKIKFNLVPGKCLSNNRKAFLNIDKKNMPRYPNDEDREQCKTNFTAHLNLAEKGLTKIHGKQLFLHEIMAKFMTNSMCSTSVSKLTDAEERLYELQWSDHEKHYKEQVKNNSGLDQTLVLADFSGSMSGEPIQVAAALAMMISSLAPAPWSNKFISFESNPQLLEIPNVLSLREKVDYLLKSPWGGSTNFLSAIQLILDVGIKNKLTQDQMPKKLIVVSDMQFDSAHSVSSWRTEHLLYNTLNKHSNNGFTTSPSLHELTTHNLIQQAFFNAGMATTGSPWTPPTMVYWNVRHTDTQGFQVQSNTPNTQMLAGFSISLLKLVLDNEDTSTLKPPTPYETFLKAVRETDKYNPIREVVMRHHENWQEVSSKKKRQYRKKHV